MIESILTSSIVVSILVDIPSSPLCPHQIAIDRNQHHNWHEIVKHRLNVITVAGLNPLTLLLLLLSAVDSFSDQITPCTRVIRVIRRNNYLPVSRQPSLLKKWKVVGVSFEPWQKKPATYHWSWNIRWCSWFCLHFGHFYSKKLGCLGRCETFVLHAKIFIISQTKQNKSVLILIIGNIIVHCYVTT